MYMRPFNPLFVLAACALPVLACCGKQSAPDGTSVAEPSSAVSDPADAPGFNGSFPVRRPADPVAALHGVFDAGLRFDGADTQSFLRRVLAEAGVDERSQVLVFSKTSFQNDLISHDTPRAIYFSDDCYVGMVQGGSFELAQADADNGTAFYAVEFRAKPADRPKWDSPSRCMDCHEGPMVGSRTGLMVRSVFTDADNQPISSAGGFVVTHETPINDRWGGWFVTGRHGDARHMGNMVAVRRADGSAGLDRGAGANRDTLDGLVDTRPYLRPTSDIVALMVLEHQLTLHNAYTQASLSVREQVARHRAVMRELGGKKGGGDGSLSADIQGLIRNQARRVVGLMLFQGEAALPEGGVEGCREFQDAFRANMREASSGAVRGRSLKDFQLLTRLFKYRCSYTVYSRAFDMMDPLLKEEVWRTLRQALTSDDALSRHIPAGEKAQIMEILRQTKEGIPAWW